MSAIVEKREALEAKIEAQETELSARDLQLRAQEAELQTLKINEASLRERATSLRRELETGARVIADRERRVQEITRTLERALKEHEQFNGGESGLEQKIEAMTAKLSEERAQLAQIKELLEQSGAKLNAGLDRIKYLHKVGDEKTAAANQLSLDGGKSFIRSRSSSAEPRRKIRPELLRKAVPHSRPRRDG